MNQRYESLEANWAAVEGILGGAFRGRRVEVLEAGGGSSTNVGFLPDVEFTAIDISPEQIARNTYARHGIVADLESFDGYRQRYDLIVLNDVLEHMNAPEKAIERLMKQVSPGGYLLIGGPVPTSFKGLLTKLTPHGFHVWVYRALLDQPTAGLPGHAPFKTFLRFSVTPGPIAREARAAGLEIVHVGLSKASWVIEGLRNKSPVLSGAYSLLMQILRVLSLGLWHPELTDMLILLKRPEPA